MLTDSDTKRLSEELQKHLIRLIQFNTTNPPGNETAACEYIKEQLAGVGLAGMRERVRQLGGRFEIESSGRGTTVRAIVPEEAGAA